MNVGATGHLDLNELSVVCDHIGMDSMNEQVQMQLKCTVVNLILETSNTPISLEHAFYFLSNNVESSKVAGSHP